MEENRETIEEEKETEEQEEEVVLRVHRHLYPEEVELKKVRKDYREYRIYARIMFVVILLFGWLGGSLLPYGFTSSLRSMISRGLGLDGTDKVAAVKEVLEEDWYFGKDIEDLDERLTDQAIEGLVSNSEDTHTLYFSAEESESFRQVINRNYCGIGIQYLEIDGKNIVTKVFEDSPALKAGIETGDILYEADGIPLTGKSDEEIRELVQGEEGTIVSLKVMRGDKIIGVSVERKNLVSIADGRIIDDQIGYLQLYQFGDSSGQAARKYLDTFQEAGVSSLIIDLRDNGGGYLTSVTDVASLFLPKGSVVLQAEDRQGNITVSKTKEEQYSSIGPIVVLINENTASAAEVLTMALYEQRDDVTIVGTTSYGKGTVQVERKFSDGSSLNYTVQRWLTSKGVWINDVGISPDIEVRLHDVFYHGFTKMKDGEVYDVDSVSASISDMALCLDYLGYATDRSDGYFSQQLSDSLRQFQKDYGLEETGRLDIHTYNTLYGQIRYHWQTTQDTDTQLAKAIEVVKGM